MAEVKGKGQRDSDAVYAATVVVGGTPREMSRTALGIKHKIIWVGIVSELTDMPGIEIARTIGCGHSNVHDWRRRLFDQLDWRERHGWRLLAEHISGRTESVQSSMRQIMDSVSLQLNSMTPIGCYSTQRQSVW